MTRVRDDEIANLEIGDVIYECEGFTNIEVRITSKPVASISEPLEGRTQWRWTAENTQNGKSIDYLLTEGLSHYGPRLYRQPAYVTIGKDGEWKFELYGAPEAV